MILVTGATGFIGKNLCIEFLRRNINFYCIVRDTTNTHFFEINNIPFFRLKDDVYEIEKLLIKMNTKGLIHLASCYLPEHKPEDILAIINSNIYFGSILLEASKRVSLKWFINTGTFWQHFNGEEYNPVNFYSASKESFEKIAKYYTETSDLIFLTIKLNDTYGPNDTRNKIFNLWDQLVKSNTELDMSPGKQLIDICHVSKVIKSYIKIIKILNSSNANDLKNKSLYVTSGKLVTLKELARNYELEKKVKLNINWGGKPYRSREVMKPDCLGQNIDEI